MLTGLTLVLIYAISITWCGPWDPWETHYGEVARNIVRRRDPLDLWWKPGYGPDGAEERYFWSKHALPFWCMALSLWVFGVGTSSDPGEMVHGPWPEIALRLPSLLAGLATIAFVGFVVWRLVNWRAGILTALVLGTMPQFAIVTRQALTDMFFVGPVCLALGAWALAWLQPDRQLRTEGRRIRVPFDRLYLAFLVAFIVGAVAPLAVLHHHVISEFTINRVIRFGRHAGPGSPNVVTLDAIKLQLIPYWVLVLVVLGFSLRWRRASQAWMGLVYLAGGLALMGKGMIGPGVIGVLILSHMLVSGRTRLLLHCGLPVGMLIFIVACVPWHHSMWLYRGERWARELLFENNLQRFATGEQDQAVGNFGFYVRTLGMAAFPWVAVVPITLYDAWRRLRHRGDADRSDPESAVDVHRLALLWFVVTFATITYSTTKYFHYLLATLPPLAVMTGIWLDGLIRPTSATPERRTDRSVVVACALSGLIVLGLVLREALHEPAWIAHLTTYLYTAMWREGAPVPTRLIWMSIPFGLGLLIWAARRTTPAVGAMVFSALLTTVYVIDDYLPAASESWSQRTAFRHYFDNRGPDDPILGWWFKYRGETYFAKGRIWVLTKPDRAKLSEFIDDNRGKSLNLWFITTVGHAKRLRVQLPRDLQDSLSLEYENFHYALMRLPVP